MTDKSLHCPALTDNVIRMWQKYNKRMDCTTTSKTYQSPSKKCHDIANGSHIQFHYKWSREFYTIQQSVTYDLSFPGKLSSLSVNSRTQMDLLEPCQYGLMLARTIHYIIALWTKNQNLTIVLKKINFKSAYRCQPLNAETAVQCMSSAQVDQTKFVLLNLWLSFRGSACVFEWCIVSEKSQT